MLLVIIAFVAVIASWVYSHETMEKCMNEGNGYLHCRSTFKFQNAKRMLGL